MQAANPGGAGTSQSQGLPGVANPQTYSNPTQMLQQMATARLAANSPTLNGASNPTGVGMNPAMSYQAPTNPGMAAASPLGMPAPQSNGVQMPPLAPRPAFQAPPQAYQPPPPTALQSFMNAPQAPQGPSQAQMAAMHGYGQMPSFQQPQAQPMQQQMGGQMAPQQMAAPGSPPPMQQPGMAPRAGAGPFNFRG